MKLFIYGTFMPGESRWWEIEPSVKRVSPGFVKGHLYDLGAFPVAVIKKHGKILGLTIDVSQKLINFMDSIEGINSKNPNQGLYKRGEVSVYHMNGKSQGTAWIYHMIENQVLNYKGTLIESGCWKHRG